MVKEDILNQTQVAEKLIQERLYDRRRHYPVIGDIRGIGLLWAIDLVKDKDTKEKAVDAAENIMYHCLKNGLSFKVSKGNVLTLSPPLIISREELEAALDILEDAFKCNGHVA
jgi:4-aminobutyrate aminotransferase